MRPSRSTAKRRLSRSLASALLPALLSLGACADAPQLPQAPRGAQPAHAPSAAAVAQQLNVTDPRGKQLNEGQTTRVVQEVAAQGRGDAIKRQLGAMASFGDVDLYSGNDAKLLIDGPATFKAMFDAVEKAKHTVMLESYIIEDADVSRRLATLLVQKHAQGVNVLLIYDALGSLGTEAAYFDSLKQGGVAVCAFNGLAKLTDIAHRDHRKILTVDREIGFTGGINLSAVYSSGSFGRSHARPAKAVSNKDGWRDTQIQMRGPAVADLDDLVRQTWQQQQCDGALPALPDIKAAKPAGEQLMRIVPSSPDDSINRIYALLLTSIGAARQSIQLTMAYFAPGDDMVQALCDAARRGVNVQLILPSLSDFSPVLHAGRSHYGTLLAAGVKVYELQDAVLHAKTAVIDGVVSAVGSSNMDSRSFTGNNEIDAVVIGEDFGGAMTHMFEQDLQASHPVTLEAWNSRSLCQRSKEFFARIFESWW